MFGVLYQLGGLVISPLSKKEVKAKKKEGNCPEKREMCYWQKFGCETTDRSSKPMTGLEPGGMDKGYQISDQGNRAKMRVTPSS